MGSKTSCSAAHRRWYPSHGAKRARVPDFGYSWCARGACASFPTSDRGVSGNGDAALPQRRRKRAFGETPRFDARAAAARCRAESRHDPVNAVDTKWRKHVNSRGVVLHRPTRCAFYNEQYESGDRRICRTALGVSMPL